MAGKLPTKEELLQARDWLMHNCPAQVGAVDCIRILYDLVEYMPTLHPPYEYGYKEEPVKAMEKFDWGWEPMIKQEEELKGWRICASTQSAAKVRELLEEGICTLWRTPLRFNDTNAKIKTTFAVHPDSVTASTESEIRVKVSPKYKIISEV